MKKVIVFLLIVLSTIGVKGQKGWPIKPYRENDYSLDEVKVFAFEQTTLSANWRREFINIVNIGLRASGETLVVDESNVIWALGQIVYGYRELGSFSNSKRIGEEIKFYPDKGFKGMVAIFNYGKCSLVVYKTRCMNLLKVPVTIIKSKDPVSAPKQKDPVVSKTPPPVVVVDTVPESKWHLDENPPLEERQPSVFFPKQPRETGKFKIGWVVIPVAAIAVGIIAYKTIRRTTPSGTPGGAGVSNPNPNNPTPTPTPTPDPVPTGGGPGGAGK